MDSLREQYQAKAYTPWLDAIRALQAEQADRGDDSSLGACVLELAQRCVAVAAEQDSEIFSTHATQEEGLR